VVVVDQEAVRVEEPAVSLQDTVENREKAPVVRIVAEDRLTRVAADDDVIDRARVGDAMGSGDPARLALRRQRI
jgi:hypothetical protein